MARRDVERPDLDQFEREIRIIQHHELTNGEDRPIGFGSRGNVYIRQYEGNSVAVKYINQPNGDEGLNEARNLNRINHINVVQLVGYCRQPIALVMELAPNGNVHDAVMNRNFEHHLPYGTLSIEWVKQCAKGLAAMHNMEPPLLHRDIKPQNLLLFDNYELLKIGDFDCSRDYSSRMTSNRGTVSFMAPEILVVEEMASYTSKIDVYSFAVTMWQIMARREPYENFNAYRIMWSVSHRGLRPEAIDSPLYPLMEQCWQQDPQQRLDMAEVNNRLQPH